MPACLCVFLCHNGGRSRCETIYSAGDDQENWAKTPGETVTVCDLH